MRTGVGVALLAVCLGLTGCSLFGKRGSRGGGGSTPFVGSAPEARATAPAAAGGAELTATPTSSTSGVLAGQVLDPLSRRAGGARIQVVDLEETDKKSPRAKLDVETTSEGFFVISGLRPGRHYQLVASMQEGKKVLSGNVFATPPNPRLSIYLSEDFTSPATPEAPKPPQVPGRAEAPKDDKAGGHPAASLDPPVKSPGKPSSTAPGAIPGPAATVYPADPSRIAGEGLGPVRPGVAANVPGPGQDRSPYAPVIPPDPNSLRREGTPTSPLVPPPGVGVVPTGPGAALPGLPSPVPSCVLVGKRLDNFALYDLDGRPWEFRRDRTGRLVLLDFWYSTCGPCLEEIPHLVKLQRDYGPYGLQVVGIAYEKGTPAQQALKVRGVRGRLSINYTTLLGGGGTGPCPVRSQFGVECFPTLILLDADNQIIWRTQQGVGPQEKYDVEMLIRRQLGIRDR